MLLQSFSDFLKNKIFLEDVDPESIRFDRLISDFNRWLEIHNLTIKMAEIMAQKAGYPNLRAFIYDNSPNKYRKLRHSGQENYID